MKPLGVNRVTIAVKDIDKGKELYSELLGATFHSAISTTGYSDRFLDGRGISTTDNWRKTAVLKGSG